MNAATRAVIERMVEALEQYAPRDRAVTQDLITDARKLLEGDALAQPADEDAWLVEAERLEESAIHAAYEEADVERRFDGFVTQITPNERQASYERTRHFRNKLRAHLRTRPAREGFVSVPVEWTDEQQESAQMMLDSTRKSLGSAMSDETMIGVIYDGMTAPYRKIEAAKGDGK